MKLMDAVRDLAQVIEARIAENVIALEVDLIVRESFQKARAIVHNRGIRPERLEGGARHSRDGRVGVGSHAL